MDEPAGDRRQACNHALQVFCLERLAAKDLITARSVLGAMVQARPSSLWPATCRHPLCLPCASCSKQHRAAPVLPQSLRRAEHVLPDQALERMSDKALPEWAPFAATLAQRLAKLVGSGHLGPDQALWTLAVDHFLLRAVDTEGQVRCICPHPLLLRFPAPCGCNGCNPIREPSII